MPRKQNKKTEEATGYVVTLAFKDGEKITETGDTVIEAMSKIKTNPKQMGLLSIDFGGKHVEKVFNASVLKRMFGANASVFIRKNALSSYSKFLASGLC